MMMMVLMGDDAKSRMKCKFGNIKSESGEKVEWRKQSEAWRIARGRQSKETSCWLNFVTGSLFSLTGHRGAFDFVPLLVRRMSNRLRIMAHGFTVAAESHQQ